MAKLVRRVTSNDEIVGSNPARGIYFLLDLCGLFFFIYHECQFCDFKGESREDSG